MDSYTSDGRRERKGIFSWAAEWGVGMSVYGCVCVWTTAGSPQGPTESEQFWIPARIAQETDKGWPKSMQKQLAHS